VKKGDFKESTELFDCKKGQLVIRPIAEDSVVISFYPTFPMKEILWTVADNKDMGNEEIKNFHLKVRKEANFQNRNNFSAILIGSTKLSRKIQSCHIHMKLIN
jgi:hypothetical protein